MVSLKRISYLFRTLIIAYLPFCGSGLNRLLDCPEALLQQDGLAERKLDMRFEPYLSRIYLCMGVT